MFPHLLAGFAAGLARSTTVNLQNAQTDCDTSGGPVESAVIYYRENRSSRAGEVWGEDTCTNVFQHTPIDPVTDTALYEIKWDYLSGDAPYAPSSSTEGVYVDLATQSLVIAWRASGGPTSEFGAVTVTMRQKGTTTPTYTATWDGQVSLSGKGK